MIMIPKCYLLLIFDLSEVDYSAGTRSCVDPDLDLIHLWSTYCVVVCQTTFERQSLILYIFYVVQNPALPFAYLCRTPSLIKLTGPIIDEESGIAATQISNAAAYHNVVARKSSSRLTIGAFIVVSVSIVIILTVVVLDCHGLISRAEMRMCSYVIVDVHLWLFNFRPPALP